MYRSSLVEKHVTKTELPHKLTPLYEALTETEKGWSNSKTKRFFDFTVAFVSLLLLWPIFSVISLAILFDSEGPAIFRQYRIGRMGHPFIIYKFRTMFRDAEHGPRVTTLGDQRTTRIGSILRKTKLDELPQLLNVLKGDMSLVGPRPLPVRDYEGFSEDWQRRRFSVRPGITCLWQVNGRSSIPFEQWMKLDLQYLDQWSLWLDIKILARTVSAVLKGSGAA